VPEGLISYVLEEVLAEEGRNTALNIEKKQSLSWMELEAERVAEETVAEQSMLAAAASAQDGDGTEEQPMHSPKALPLGWGGKSIAYCLYKLHGLKHEFKCEI
jgi:splicing factor 3A subunit 3